MIFRIVIGRVSVALALLGLLSVGACAPDELLDDYYLDRWCGDAPCAWEVEGDIERIGTWHESDYAISLESQGAAISQWNDDIAGDIGCVEISTLARVGEDADVVFLLGYNDSDGDYEVERELSPSETWTPRVFEWRFRSEFEGVRFVLQKRGEGLAEIAQFRVRGFPCTRLPARSST